MNELDRDLGPGEFEEWMAYYYFEPFGTVAEDHRWRTHYALQWYSGGTQKECPNFLDRDPDETARIAAEQAAAAAQVSLADKIMAFFNARDVIEAPPEDPTA